MRNHRDTNVGMGMVYDTPEEKEIERLSKLLSAERAAHQKTREEQDALAARVKERERDAAFWKSHYEALVRETHNLKPKS